MARFKINDVCKVTEGNRKGQIVVIDEESRIPDVKNRNGEYIGAELEDTLELATGWDRLVRGSKIKDVDGHERTVLGVCGDVFFISKYGDKQYKCEGGYTIKEFEWRNSICDNDPLPEKNYAYDKDGKVIGEIVDGKIIK